MSSEGNESSRTIEFLAWLEVNKQRLAVGAIACGILVGGVALLRFQRAQRERAASSALIQVQQASRSEGEAKAVPVSALQRVADEHSGTAAGGRARLLAAAALFQEGRYAEAQSEFERARQVLDDESLIATAAYGVATSLDAQGKTNEALTAYQDVLTRHASSSVAAQARLALGGLYEAKGEFSLALRSYSELTNALTSPWRSTASQRAESVLASHPELAPTNAPAASMPSPGLTATNLPGTLSPVPTNAAPPA